MRRDRAWKRRVLTHRAAGMREKQKWNFSCGLWARGKPPTFVTSLCKKKVTIKEKKKTQIRGHRWWFMRKSINSFYIQIRVFIWYFSFYLQMASPSSCKCYWRWPRRHRCSNKGPTLPTVVENIGPACVYLSLYLYIDTSRYISVSLFAL